MARGLLDTPLQFMADVAVHRSDDSLRPLERTLKFALTAGHDIQNGDFEDHGAAPFVTLRNRPAAAVE